jgi:transposase InsO family protein
VIVGWQLATHMRAELVLDALEMAKGLRRPGAGLIAHSDRGSQYTSMTYTDRLDELGIDPSVGSKGDAYDNAMAEAWVATFKTELVDLLLGGSERRRSCRFDPGCVPTAECLCLLSVPAAGLVAAPGRRDGGERE